MVLDPATLVVVACIMTLVVGGLLLFSWFQDRRIHALRWWSVACIVAALASLLFLAGGYEVRSLGREIGNGAFMLGYSLSYGAACRFNERPIPWLGIAAGPLAWFAAVWILDIDFVERVVMISLLVAIYGAVTTRELWTGPDALVSQRAAAIVTAINGTYFFGRIFAGPGLFPSFGWMAGLDTAWVSMVGLVLLLYVMTFGFLVMSMAKEKTDLEHRRAALVDPLTGVANRRAFMVRAESLLGGARQAGQPAAVIMFDLDHFKAVNDTHGHLTGDDILVEFAAIAVARLPSRSMFCRMGGEEFAAIVPGTDHVTALDIAERIRRDLCAEGRRVTTTVSAGVSVTTPGRDSLAQLLSAADEALYRAKQEGRNRVAVAGASAGRNPASAAPPVGLGPALA